MLIDRNHPVALIVDVLIQLAGALVGHDVARATFTLLPLAISQLPYL
jgi:hypothetical protein